VTRSPARRLILLYAGLTGLWTLWVLIPGGPSFESVGSAVFGIVLSAILLWRLWNGSAAAWLLSLGLDLFTLVGVVLFSPSGVTPFVFIAFAIALVLILLSKPVRGHVWSRQDPGVATG
jgi:hypothetical protein